MQRLDLIIKYVFACLILNSNVLLGQNVLNLRLGFGYYEEFLDHNPRMYVKAPDEFNPYVNVAPYKNGHGSNWLLLEGEVEFIKNQKYSVKIGYLFNMGAKSGFKAEYHSLNSNGEVNFSSFGNLYDSEYLKIPIQFQIKVFEVKFDKKNDHSGRFSLWPTIGMSFLRFYAANQYKSFSYHPIANESMQFYAIDGSAISVQDKLFKFSNNNASVFGGINLKFHTKKSEIFSLGIFYEHVILPANRTELRVFSPNKTYYYETYGKGNNLSFKFSFPVFSYNFTKKKFYRD